MKTLRPAWLLFGLSACTSFEGPVGHDLAPAGTSEATLDHGSEAGDDASSGDAGGGSTAQSSSDDGDASDASEGGTTAADALAPPGTWITVAPGTFTMGARPGDPCPMSGDNDIAHEVTLTDAFEISATEITQAQYEDVRGAAHPWATTCADCPLAMVTWHEAAAVCNAWSDFAGLPACYACTGEGAATSCTPTTSPYACGGYHLPTEAQWEYAARAGETAGAHGGQIEVCGSADPRLDTLGWYLFNADGGTHPVAQKLPNAWGLFDTIGNVWEWTHDGYVQDLSTVPADDPLVDAPDGLHVMRGGSYNCIPGEVRLAHRSGLPGEISGLNVGVRCARTLQ